MYQGLSALHLLLSPPIIGNEINDLGRFFHTSKAHFGDDFLKEQRKPSRSGIRSDLLFNITTSTISVTHTS